MEAKKNRPIDKVDRLRPSFVIRPIIRRLSSSPTALRPKRRLNEETRFINRFTALSRLWRRRRVCFSMTTARFLLAPSFLKTSVDSVTPPSLCWKKKIIKKNDIDIHLVRPCCWAIEKKTDGADDGRRRDFDAPAAWLKRRRASLHTHTHRGKGHGSRFSLYLSLSLSLVLIEHFSETPMPFVLAGSLSLSLSLTTLRLRGRQWLFSRVEDRTSSISKSAENICKKNKTKAGLGWETR